MTTSKDLPQAPASENGAIDAALAETKLPVNGKSANGKSAQQLKGSEPPQGKPQLPEVEPKQDRAAWKDRLFGTTIRGRLLRAVLPTLLIPLAAVSGLAIRDIRITAQEAQLTQQKELALLLAEDFSAELIGTQKALEVLATTPTILDAARAGARKAQEDGLTLEADAILEERFATTKLLSPNQLLNDYLVRVAEVEGFAEVFFTDRNGFNVAYSNPTSDFVQDDEGWWQEGKAQGQFLDSPEFDESTGSVNVDLVQAIADPNSGAFLGTIKAGLPINKFAVVEALGAIAEEVGLTGTEAVQVVDVNAGVVISTIRPEGAVETQETIGGEQLVELVRLMLTEIRDPNFEVQQVIDDVRDRFPVKNFKLQPFFDVSGERELVAEFALGDKEYAISAVPQTDWVSVASIDLREFQSAGDVLLFQVGALATVLAAAAIGLTFLFARQFARPVDNLTAAAQKVAEGDLEVRALELGTTETQTLARSFNAQVAQVKSLLAQQEAAAQTQLALQADVTRQAEETAEQQRLAAEEQQKQKETLQMQLLQLLTDVEGAAEGDLTVRAELSAEEIGTVADFFNAIIESLRGIVVQVKDSATQVSTSLNVNENAINQLAEETLAQAADISTTLNSVEQMALSIQDVADSAQQAADVAQTASSTALQGGAAMDKTVNSIVSLRSTVAETAKKVKRLGESSQQISQVVSLINEIALKTNLLAVNASIEAARAGEEGRGFAVVAEEVGALADQSAAATKDIERVVANIQAETNEVVEAMEVGTSEVVESTRLVEETKQNLENILAVSSSIDELLQSISTATVSQTQTSQEVTELMQQLTATSERASDSSRQVAGSLQDTVEIAQKLQDSVGQFKVGDS